MRRLTPGLSGACSKSSQVKSSCSNASRLAVPSHCLWWSRYTRSGRSGARARHAGSTARAAWLHGCADSTMRTREQAERLNTRGRNRARPAIACTAVPDGHAACRFASRPLQKAGIFRKMLARSYRSSQQNAEVHRATRRDATCAEPFRTSAQDRTATRTEADLRAAQMVQPTNGQRHARRNLGDTAAGWACSQNAWRRLAHVQELPNCVRQRYDLHWRCTLRLHALDSRCACAWTLVGQIRT